MLQGVFLSEQTSLLCVLWLHFKQGTCLKKKKKDLL